MGVFTDITRNSAHQTVFFFALALFAVSLPLSRYFITISEIILFANWLAEGDFRNRLRLLRNDRPALAFIMIYGLSVIGLLWSRDPVSGIENDLLHKSPTLFLPVIFATTPAPDGKRVRTVLMLFISSVFIASAAGLLFREFRADPDFRSASPFMPGIYTGMMLIIASGQLPLLARQAARRGPWLWLSLAGSGWFILYLIYLRTLSGVISLAVIVTLLMVVLVLRLKSRGARIAAMAAAAGVAGLLLWPLAGIYRQVHAANPVSLHELPAATVNGTPYLHDTVSIIRENGNPVYIFLADPELRESWNRRSDLDFEGTDLMGQELKATIYRYMSSFGLRKDSIGMAMLSDRDIRAIERGITNHLNVDRPGIYVRAYEEIMSLDIYYTSGRRETSWGSLTKRIDLWRSSIVAFRKHPLLGWGTGGVLKAMDYGMEQTGSTLAGLNMKPHSQYLHVLISHGMTGSLSQCRLGVSFSGGKSSPSFMFMFLVMFLVNFAGNNSLDPTGTGSFRLFSLLYAYHYRR
jgi:hypothetical protein